MSHDSVAPPPGAETQTDARARRVLLLATDERSGLVAAIADVCHHGGVSLEIATGIGHVLLTFDADGPTTERIASALQAVSGVSDVRPYAVIAERGE